MLSQAVQDYVKTIFNLQKAGNVSTTAIAKALNVSGASVTGMLKRLSQMNLVDYSSYKGVKLTESGEKVALQIIRFHRLLETYLLEKLDFSLDKVHDEACRLEHFISEEFIEKITDQLGDPKFDPHGHPIPTKEGDLPAINELPLSELNIGTSYIISRLCDKDPKLLAYLEEMQLLPGTKFAILEKEPFNGPIKIKYNGKEKIIGFEVANNIFINYKG
jgi:DtxR family Mn-dependent transcriptional regulator